MAMGPVPDRDVARERYRRLAPRYDVAARTWQALRRRAVDQLGLRRGDTVLDVACGTGMTFDLLEQAVGPEGRVIGIDLSPEMLARARNRADAAGWQNVSLIEAPVEVAQIAEPVDAAIFCWTHDVMRTRTAVENVVDALVPGGRVVSISMKWAPRWAAPVNLAIRLLLRRYVTTFEGLDRPWSHLERIVPTLRVESLLGGALYLAVGTKAGDRSPPS